MTPATPPSSPVRDAGIKDVSACLRKPLLADVNIDRTSDTMCSARYVKTSRPACGAMCAA